MTIIVNRDNFSYLPSIVHFIHKVAENSYESACDVVCYGWDNNSLEEEELLVPKPRNAARLCLHFGFQPNGNGEPSNAEEAHL